VETGKVPDKESALKMKEALGGISDPRQQGRRSQGRGLRACCDGNQPMLHGEIAEYFRRLDEAKLPPLPEDIRESDLERRRVRTACDIGFLSGAKKRKGLRTIVERRSERIVTGGETKVTRRYYIGSRDCAAAEFGWIPRGRPRASRRCAGLPVLYRLRHPCSASDPWSDWHPESAGTIPRSASSMEASRSFMFVISLRLHSFYGVLSAFTRCMRGSVPRNDWLGCCFEGSCRRRALP